MPGSRDVIVSIGMPAYNAERTIRAAVEGLLQQSFADFEVIISDNASTDGTWPIIEAYALQDSRIRATRQARNIGANANYCATFRASRGRYFKWASSNDWCAPDLLEKCVTHLDAHPDSALVAPRTRLFAERPEEYTDYHGDVAFDQEDPVERFQQVSSRLALNNVLNGLFRTAVLQRTRLIEHYPAADCLLIAHVALLGKIRLLEERLYYRRMRVDAATPLMDEERQRRHFYPQPTLRSLLPDWQMAAGLFRVALTADLQAGARWRALAWALRLAYWQREQMWRDLVAALHYPIR